MTLAASRATPIVALDLPSSGAAQFAAMPERKPPKKGKQMEMVAGRWQPAGGDDARLDKQVQMVAGACCHPECSVKRAVRVALAGGEACERTVEGEWVMFA